MIIYHHVGIYGIIKVFYTKHTTNMKPQRFAHTVTFSSQANKFNHIGEHKS